MLIYVIPGIVLLSTISPKIVSWMVKLLKPAETPAQACLRQEIREQKAQLAATSMVDEFPTYARLERKLNRLQAEYNALASQSRNSEIKRRILFTTVSHCITGAAMLYVVFFYGSEPVVQLPAASLFPLGYLLAIPGCELGCITATSWVLIATSVVRRSVAALT